jgi:hypothetical protein
MLYGEPQAQLELLLGTRKILTIPAIR